MNDIDHVVVNKNRGWRGLAEVKVRTKEYKEITKMIFSFSPAVWTDLVNVGALVMQDDDFYYVLKFGAEDRAKLPIGHQRSVLIKNWIGKVREVDKIAKTEWRSAEAFDWNAISHFIKNRNNHTQSDWNCIGIRVIPEI